MMAVRQMLAIAWMSFGPIARRWSGLPLLAAIAMVAALWGPLQFHRVGVAMLPTTARVTSLLAVRLVDTPQTAWALIPLLIVFYAGELVWLERDAGLNDMVDTTPVPEWVLFLGKYLGLALLLVARTAFLTAAAVLVQVEMGYFDIEIGHFLRVFFGLQLIDDLLFAWLVFVLYAVIDQKQLGALAALLAYVFIAFAARFGIDQTLLVFGSDPGWSYTDMRQFGASLTPWLWFKVYWAAWALLLGVVARLLWVRGKESGARARLMLARTRVTRLTGATAVATLAAIVALGGFIFYNTDVLDAHGTAATERRRAEYEKRYAKYAGIAQPRLTQANLRIEIDPTRQAADIRAVYALENRSAGSIDSIHLSIPHDIEIGAITCERATDLVTQDDDLGYRIYALNEPLLPGDSLRLHVDVHHQPAGFRSRRTDALVVANGTYLTSADVLPAIGYQRDREIDDARGRKRYGLTPRPAIPALDDAEARARVVDRVAVETIVGTDEGQTAIAPGTLRRSWTERGRRYFHYATDIPIPNGFSIFSARYAVHEAQWHAVPIRIYHDPRPQHSENLDRMVRGIRAALDYFTAQFGPYPYADLTIVERGTRGDALHAEASLIHYGEGFALFRPQDRDPDLVFYAMARVVASEWWEHGMTPAGVEGQIVMAESLANYSGMQVLERTLGHEHLERYLREALWASYQVPRSRAAVPLLRANSPFLGYRKGTQVLYALSRYLGEERLNLALRRLFDKHRSGVPPLPTTRDLYQELQAVTPDSLQYLLHDLFEANTFWNLETPRATAERTAADAWQVTLDVRARKVVVDETGIETERPMDDWIDIGLFAAPEHGEALSTPLYLQKHHITSGLQTITLTVPTEPSRAGIDPYNLLIDWKMGSEGYSSRNAIIGSTVSGAWQARGSGPRRVAPF